MKNEINLLDVIFLLLKNRWRFLKIVFIATLLAVITSLVWPKTYKCTVRFFPPAKGSTGISGFFSTLFQPIATSSELSTEALLVVLDSRTIKEDVILKFKLNEVYNSDIIEFLLKKLEANIIINEMREGGFGFNPLIAVEFSFLDKDPKRATEIVEYYIHKTDSVLKTLNRERAINTMVTIENRYHENMQTLEIAETNLKNFKEKYGIFEIQTQIISMIEKMAELKSEILKIDIQLEILGKVSSENNYQIIQLLNEKTAYENKYNELLIASESYQSADIFHPLNKIPQLAKDYTNLIREVTIQNKMYEFLYPQYEQAKLQVSMYSKGIQMLDQAKIPTYKYRPKRIFIVLAGFIAGLLVAALVIFLNELIESERNQNSINYQKYKEITELMRKELKFWKK